MPDKTIYTLGGTVQASDGIYISRKADDELLRYCVDGEYAYVLSSRQMGKSSLMVRTSEELEKREIVSIIIDLTEFGVFNKSDEQWFLGLLVQIAEPLIEDDVLDWWKKYSDLGVTVRFSSFLEKILEEVDRQIVVFIDEIDMTLGLSFGDDFFALIRYFYNSRAKNPKFKKLSFVLLGVATPSQLISDTRRTPFNIGKRVKLTDFTFQEALPLADGFKLQKSRAEAALQIILEWTDGHPYLAQYICSNIAERLGDAQKNTDLRDFIGETVNLTLLSEEGKQNNHNIKFVRDYLLSTKDLLKLLEIYSQVRNDKKILDDAKNSFYSTLKLSGIVKIDRDRNLRVRNRIYYRIFDSVWIDKLKDQVVGSSKKKKADVFISYSHRDEKWVVNYLLSYLEKMNLEVIIDYRDFVLGQTNYQNIKRALKRSKFILLVLSPGWIASEQDVIGELLSQAKNPAKLNQRIIPILLDECEVPSFISKSTCINFTEKDNSTSAWGQLLFALGLSQTSQKTTAEMVREVYRQVENRIDDARSSNATTLDLSADLLSPLSRIDKIPKSLGQLKQLQELNLAGNELSILLESLRLLTQLEKLDLSANQLTELPDWIGQLTQLKTLNLSNNKLSELPESLGKLDQLSELQLSGNQFIQLPICLRQLGQLRSLTLSNNQLTSVPEWLPELTHLQSISFYNNRITDLPPSLAKLKYLNEIDLDNNPLNPELAATYAISHNSGLEVVKQYLRAKVATQFTLNEAKLVLVGEGESGKSSLLSALCNEPWTEDRSTTYGIEIKPVKVIDPGSKMEITLNSWEFGGQLVFRPLIQLFFSAPAIYLVVWKPSEGPQQGFVKEWIQLIMHREPDAKILVVATHGGPQDRQPDIDHQELWDLFGRETVLDFFHVESKPNKKGNRYGIEELKQAIARVAATLPEMGRSVPKRWQDVRQALAKTGATYLPLERVYDLCRDHNMDVEEASLFITISHRLGLLIHYEYDPILRDIVVLKPDWLATAISFILEDKVAREGNGFVPFSRLSQIWNDATRKEVFQYPPKLHPKLLRLMERFDLSYRVAAPTSKGDSDPVFLIAHLVPYSRPEEVLEREWPPTLASDDTQRLQICRIVDAQTGQSASAVGLFYQLIVRLHKYSLGKMDYNYSVHWQRGLVLDDNYNGRALLIHSGNDIHITVRAVYPESFLAILTSEVKFLVESFWAGLRCEVMVPCIEPCGINAPGTGLFEVEKLIESKLTGRSEYPCPACNEWQDIDSLLRNAPAGRPPLAGELLAERAMISELRKLRDLLELEQGTTMRRFAKLDMGQREVLSKIDASYTGFMESITDEAKEGPRLFSIIPVDRSKFNPKEWTKSKFRLTLWCEHSRLPLPLLNGKNSKKGVYDIEVNREWFRKAGPYLNSVISTLSLILPVSSSMVKISLDENAYKVFEEQLDFGKSIIDTTMGDSIDAADKMPLERGEASRVGGAALPLRELHAMLKAKDPSFGDLVRVLNRRGQFLWVHPQFEAQYR